MQQCRGVWNDYRLLIPDSTGLIILQSDLDHGIPADTMRLHTAKNVIAVPQQYEDVVAVRVPPLALVVDGHTCLHLPILQLGDRRPDKDGLMGLRRVLPLPIRAHFMRRRNVPHIYTEPSLHRRAAPGRDLECACPPDVRWRHAHPMWNQMTH